MADALEPPPRRTADEWADDKLELPPGSAEPGKYRSSRVPFISPIVRAIRDPRYRRIVYGTGSQLSKTQGVVLNEIGRRCDEEPTPIMYLGPTKSFVTKKFEPRLRKMFLAVPSIREKFAGGKKDTKTSKEVGGITIEFAWAGSASEVAGSPVGLGFCDERDRMGASVEGEGDPTELLETRGATYPGFKLVLTSSVTMGNLEVERDPESGLEHWKLADPNDIQSPTWKLWQEGTRFEWAWPCPECRKYFVPRLRNLWWPENAAPPEVLRDARLKCPNCEALIPSSAKPQMNDRGRFAAPGQKILEDGTVVGDPPDSSTASFWVSGLCSPWRSFGRAAERWVRAARGGDPERMKTVLNTEFGELYAVRGEAPKSELVAARREPYHFGEVAGDVRVITIGVDPAKDRFHFVVRGWGAQMTSWLLMHGVLWGDTDTEASYQKLTDLLHTTWGAGDVPVHAMLVDSGWKPKDRWRRPEHRIYEFARRFPGWVRPSKGREVLEAAVKLSKIDYTTGNQRIPQAVELVLVNTDHMKSWIHGRLEWPLEEPGAWHIPIDCDPEYCAHLAAESRLVLASGRVRWIQSGPNHYFDCEVLALAAAWMLGVPLMRAELAEETTEHGSQPVVVRSKWLSRAGR